LRCAGGTACSAHAGSFLTALALGTLLAAPVAAAPYVMTSVQVRDQFLQCGYEVGNPGTPPTSRYLVVRDPGVSEVRGADYRIVMAIVYPSEAAARAQHERAHRQAEERLGVRWPFSDNQGPQLLAGYGASVWRANVALVQSSRRTLDSMYSWDVQTDETRLARPELFELGFVSNSREYGVDRDFVVCLDEAAHRAAGAEPSMFEPLFLPGRPW
jgi:hypothetical protein